MSGLFTVVVVMCASALICSLVQTFVTDGSTKKIISLVLGAFIICCMVVPVKNAVSSFNTDIEEKQNSAKEISTNDEAYSNAVIKQTEINLETALKNYWQRLPHLRTGSRCSCAHPVPLRAPHRKPEKQSPPKRHARYGRALSRA